MYVKVTSLLCLSVTPICLQTTLLLNLQITCLYLVASLLVFLMKRNVLNKPECSSVRHIWTGAAPLSVKFQQLALEKLAGRAVLHHSYGLTETTFTMFTCTVDKCRLGTPGKVTPGMECKVSYI
jgi:acyl-coenzyme A synthetase/AMP-(fatty) acid ligase